MSKEAMKSDAYGQALLSAWEAVRDPGPANDDVPHPIFVQGFTACWNALPAEPPAPQQGWKWAPVEPTKEQLAAVNKLLWPSPRAQIYRVMLAALQPAPVQQEPAGTVKELFTQSAWERLDLRGSTKVYLDTPPQRRPLPKGDWPKHPSPDDKYIGYDTTDLDDYAMQVLAAHGIKENT